MRIKITRAIFLFVWSGGYRTLPGGVLMSLFICYLIQTPSMGFKGAPCVRTSDNTSGVCRPLSECYEAQPKPGFKEEKLDICGIIRQITIVCCVPKDQLGPGQVVALSSDSGGTDYIPMSVPISRKRCKEYARLVYEKITDTKGNDIGERDRCVRPADPIRPGTALLGEFPFMALLLQKNHDMITTDHICGGTLISERYVLTSAICVSHVPQFAPLEEVLSVLLGELVLYDEADGASTQVIPIIQRIIHPDFDLSMTYNDIALILLKHDAKLSHLLRPACLPHGDSDNAESFIAIGYGGRSQGQLKLENKLLKVNLIMAPFVICDKYWPAGEDGHPFGLHRLSQFCAGHPYKKNGVCNGDGGGPLLVKSVDEYCTYQVVGIVSVGPPCGSTEPDVFTRVAYFTRWIENIIWS